MSKLTVLDVVQTYLDYVDGFEVDSIFDSDESMQCATIAEHMYYTVIDKYKDFQFKSNIDTLEGLGDTNTPALMKIPDRVSYVQYARVQYNVSTTGGVKYKNVKWLAPDDFLDYINGRTTEINGAEEMVVNDVPLVVLNNRFPEYFTSFDDQYVVFDSYNKDYDSTLQEDKTQVISQSSDSFIKDDSFVIPLPDWAHSGYQDLVISEAAQALRQMDIPSASMRARKFLAELQMQQIRLGKKYNTKRSYGRR
jgi:hypothetical protein